MYSLVWLSSGIYPLPAMHSLLEGVFLGIFRDLICHKSTYLHRDVEYGIPSRINKAQEEQRAFITRVMIIYLKQWFFLLNFENKFLHFVQNLLIITHLSHIVPPPLSLSLSLSLIINFLIYWRNVSQGCSEIIDNQRRRNKKTYPCSTCCTNNKKTITN